MGRGFHSEPTHRKETHKDPRRSRTKDEGPTDTFPDTSASFASWGLWWRCDGGGWRGRRRWRRLGFPLSRQSKAMCGGGSSALFLL